MQVKSFKENERGKYWVVMKIIHPHICSPKLKSNPKVNLVSFWNISINFIYFLICIVPQIRSFKCHQYIEIIVFKFLKLWKDMIFLCNLKTCCILKTKLHHLSISSFFPLMNPYRLQYDAPWYECNQKL